MRRLRAPSIPSALLLALFGVAPTGCAEDSGEFTSAGADDSALSGGPPSEPPPVVECTFTYQNAINDNGNEVEIWLVYLFPAGSDEIGDDLLGSEVLPYGYELSVAHVPEGRYDTMVVDEDAYYYIETGVECDGSDWTWLITVADVDGQLDVASGDREELREAVADLDGLSEALGDR